MIRIVTMSFQRNMCRSLFSLITSPASASPSTRDYHLSGNSPFRGVRHRHGDETADRHGDNAVAKCNVDRFGIVKSIASPKQFGMHYTANLN